MGYRGTTRTSANAGRWGVVLKTYLLYRFSDPPPRISGYLSRRHHVLFWTGICDCAPVTVLLVLFLAVDQTSEVIMSYPSATSLRRSQPLSGATSAAQARD